MAKDARINIRLTQEEWAIVMRACNIDERTPRQLLILMARTVLGDIGMAETVQNAGASLAPNGTEWHQMAPNGASLAPNGTENPPSVEEEIPPSVVVGFPEQEKETTQPTGDLSLPSTAFVPKKAKKRKTSLDGDQKRRFDLFYGGGTLTDGTAYPGYPKKTGVAEAEIAFAEADPGNDGIEEWCRMVMRWQQSRRWQEGFIVDPERFITRRFFDPRNDPESDTAPRASPSAKAAPGSKWDAIADAIEKGEDPWTQTLLPGLPEPLVG